MIQRDEPSRAAIRPSRLVAVFSTTYERPSARCSEVRGEEARRRLGFHPDVDGDAMFAETGDAPAAHVAIRVLDGDDDPGDARVDRARRRRGVCGPWCEQGSRRDVGGGAACRGPPRLGAPRPRRAHRPAAGSRPRPRPRRRGRGGTRPRGSAACGGEPWRPGRAPGASARRPCPRRSSSLFGRCPSNVMHYLRTVQE